MKKPLVILITFLVSYFSFGQTDDCYKYSSLGYSAYNEKNFRKALEYFEKLTQCDPTANNFYNAACAASLSGDKSKGFLYLKKSISMGYLDTSHIKEDSDLENLKKDKNWKNVSTWVKDARSSFEKELAKINIGCPASNLIPYYENGNWGYLNKQTNERITDPIFSRASFVGKTGKVRFGDNNILFDCTGKILSITSGMEDIAAYNSPQKRIDSGLTKGFRYKPDRYEIGTLLYAPSYKEISFLKINYDKQIAIVLNEGVYSIVDSLGNPLLMGYKELHFYNYGMDSEYYPDYDKDGNYYFFYKDASGKKGILNPEYKPVLEDIEEAKQPRGNGFEREYLDLIRTHLYVKKGNKWGLWNTYQRNWDIQPEYDEIVLTERTFDGKIEDDYYSGKTVDLYFLVKKGPQKFFIDLNNRKYIPKK